MIGCAVAVMKFKPWFLRMALKFAAVPVSVMIYILLDLQHRTLVTQTIGLSAAAIAAAWIMLAALQNGWLKSTLSTGALVYTGRISYGWYLWHYQIILIGDEYFRRYNPYYASGILIGVGYLAAVASYHFVEQPFLRLKSRFEPNGSRGLRHLGIVTEPSLAGVLATGRQNRLVASGKSD
jgi:peptidoglycan/LPS O-acetylase OafA/YrhL